MARVIVVVPCYNERLRLDPGAFHAFLAQHGEIDFLFVDDGSRDGTGELLDRMAADSAGRIVALQLEQNGGKAEAVRRGLLAAEARGAAYAGFWDADLATPLEAIPGFVRELDDHPGVLMAFGSRVRLLGRQIERRPARHYLGRIFATVVSATLGVALYDTQCGAKLFRMGPEITPLFAAPFRSRWIFDVEILARFLQSPRSAPIDSQVHEIPLASWRDVAGSKVRPRDFVRAFFELWTIYRSYPRVVAVQAAAPGDAQRAIVS